MRAAVCVYQVLYLEGGGAIIEWAYRDDPTATEGRERERDRADLRASTTLQRASHLHLYPECLVRVVG